MDSAQNVILCDLDGTISSCAWRNHLVDEGNDWDLYYKGLIWDRPINDIMSIVQEKLNEDPKAIVIYLTAREEFLAEPYRKERGAPKEKLVKINVRELTETWLSKNNAPGWPARAKLILRKSGDSRKASFVKEDVVKKLLASGVNIIYAIDDNENIISMYKKYIPENNVLLVKDPGLTPLLKRAIQSAKVLWDAGRILTHN